MGLPHEQKSIDMSLPGPGEVMRRHDLDTWLDHSRDPDDLVRLRAAQRLCPCHTRRNEPRVWNRVLEMTKDESPRVRSAAFHALGDGSPKQYQELAVSAIESLYQDPDRKLRRRARRLLAYYRRTGKINVL